jgi:hypothetical protein
VQSILIERSGLPVHADERALRRNEFAQGGTSSSRQSARRPSSTSCS